MHVIREDAAPVWEMRDWREVDEPARAKALEQWRRDGLALDAAPVLRLALAQTHAGCMLIWACHHAPHVSQMLSLTAAETQNLHTLARALRVTLAAVLSAVWSLVVARMSDTSDATLGMAATQRSAELPGSQAAVGNFVVTLPIQVSLTDQTTLRACIQARAAAALEEQGRAPPMLGDLIEDGATAAEAPFDTILSIKKTGHAGYVHKMHLDQQVAYHSSFALAMIMRPEASLSLTALPDPNRLDAAARVQILHMTRHALVAVPSALDQPTSRPRARDCRRHGHAQLHGPQPAG